MFIVIITFFISELTFCQNNFDSIDGYYLNQITNTTNNHNRKFYVFSSVGLIEIVSIGVGYQISRDISFAIKGASTWIGSYALLFPNGASGVGIKLSYHKPFLFFNTASFDYIIYLYSTLDWESKRQPWNLGYEPFIKGHYFDVNIGKETINKSGLNIFWSIGVCLSAAKEAHILFAPSLKVGLNYNIF